MSDEEACRAFFRELDRRIREDADRERARRLAAMRPILRSQYELDPTDFARRLDGALWALAERLPQPAD